MSEKITMEESSIIQKYKQKLAEKKAQKEQPEEEQEELHEEQIDFNKYIKEYENGKRND